MYLLSIETCFSSISVSVFNEQKQIAKLYSNQKNTQSNLIDYFVKKCLTRLSILPKDITHLCVNSGPGSFTGIKIGLSFCHGFLTFSKATPIPLSCLESNAFYKNDNTHNTLHKQSDKCNIISIIPSIKDECYYQVLNAQYNQINEAKSIPLSTVMQKLEQTSPNTHIIKHCLSNEEVNRHKLFQNFTTVQTEMPNSTNIGYYALHLINTSKIPTNSNPNYVRPPINENPKKP